MIRMWRHLKLLKRGGRGYAINGVDGTSPGELALLCPACPYPFINLPGNWRKAPKESACVRNWYSACFSNLLISGSCIINPSVSMLAFVSSDVKYPHTRRTRNSVQGLRMLSPGSLINSIFSVKRMRGM